MKIRNYPDKLIAFINAIAAGTPQFQAYLDHYKPKSKQKKYCRERASYLLTRPYIKKLLERAIESRNKAFLESTSRIIAKEFAPKTLTTDELDNFHCAIIMGEVQVEEVVPVYSWKEIVDENGVVIRREKTANFMKVNRPPNIREKQASVDALYKRRGVYAPSRFLGAFGKVNDNEELEEVTPMILLANGKEIPLFTKADK